jgi:putative oxidoreductase
MNAIVNQIAESSRPYTLALMRTVLGAVFVYHGWWKVINFDLNVNFFAKLGIPLPLISSAATASVELIGGAALILGIGVAFAAIPLAIIMAVAILTVHLAAGFALPNGYEFALTLLAATLAQGALGAGAFSLENLIAGDTRISRLAAESSVV